MNDAEHRQPYINQILKDLQPEFNVYDKVLQLILQMMTTEQLQAVAKQLVPQPVDAEPIYDALCECAYAYGEIPATAEEHLAAAARLIAEHAMQEKLEEAGLV